MNPVQTEKLYGLALDYAGLTGNETVWDLYCGIGTISLFLAKKAKQVYGVEIVPQAIDDARNNAKINDITNAEFYVGKAEEVLPEYYKEYEKTHNGEKAHADVIVVDPPRKGCEESLLQTIVDMQPFQALHIIWIATAGYFLGIMFYTSICRIFQSRCNLCGCNLYYNGYALYVG